MKTVSRTTPNHPPVTNGRSKARGPAAKQTQFVQFGAMLDGSADLIKELTSLRPGSKTLLVEQNDVLAHLNNTGAALGKKYNRIETMRLRENNGEILRLERVLKTMRAHGKIIIVAGQEAWVPLAFRVSKSLQDAHAAGKAFTPPDKLGLRKMLDGLRSRHAHLHAVRWREIDLRDDGDEALQKESANAGAHVGFPAVFKPSNGGGGLGVVIVRNEPELRAAVSSAKKKQNFGGGELTGFFLEQLFEGPEYSIQATVHRGQVHVASETTKVVGKLSDGTFVETGHIAQPAGALDNAAFRKILQTAVTALGYRRGALQADFVTDHKGRVHLIDLGFRLSGMGVTQCTNRVGHESWPRTTARAMLDEPAPEQTANAEVAAQGALTLWNERQIAAAGALELPDGLEAVVKSSSAAAQIQPQSVEPALQALAERFGSAQGRLSISARHGVAEPERAIRALFEPIARLQYPALKPAEIAAAPGWAGRVLRRIEHMFSQTLNP